MNKRILSLLIAILVLISVNVYADTEEAENKYYNMANSLIETVCGEDVLPAGENSLVITRAEFVAGFEKIMNINISPCTEVEYSDVPLSHNYASEIHTALKLGWISSANSFRPADGITYPEAVKIICSAMGYDVVANASGGYPVGYMKCAADINLDNGISNYSSALTKEDVSIIFYNALNSRRYTQTGYGDILQYTESERTLAEEVYDLYRFEGTVTATPYNSLVSTTDKTNDNIVKINGISYRYTGVTPDMLGRRYEFYICENPDNPYNEIIWCFERYGVSREAKLCDAYMKSADKVVAEGEIINLASPYNFIYNGVKTTGKIDGYVGKASCTAVFTDADEDGEFETVSLNDYNYIIVESVDNDGLCIGGEEQKSIDLSVKDCNWFVDGVKCEDLLTIQKGLYAYTISNDKKLVRFYKCNNFAEMTMTAKNTDRITLDGNEYAMSQYFIENYFNKVDFNVPATYYLGINGELVYMEKLTDDYDYGYLISANVSTGLDPRTEIKLYSEDGEIIRVPLADRPTINGVKITKKAAVYLNSAESDVIKTPQLVRFYIKDGKITKIDTADVSTADNPVDYEKDDQNNKLTKYTFDKYVYRSTSTSFAPYFSVELTTVFCIPEDLEDEEAFHITDNSAFSNSDAYTNIEIYDIDTTGNAAAIVMNVSANDDSVYHSLTTYVVEKVTRVLTKDGEEVNMLHLWRNGTVIKLESPDKISLKKLSGKSIKKGDIVSVYSYDGTTISHLQLDFDVETGTLNSETGILHNSDTISSKLSYNTGFVYNAGSSYIILDKTTAADGTANFAQTNLRTFAINYNSLRNVYVYDSEEETVTSVSPAVIKTYLEYGASASDFAIVRHNLGLANIVYIYR